RYFQTQRAIRFHDGFPLRLELFNTIAVLNGAEVLPQVHHRNQEQEAQGNAKRNHLAAALGVTDSEHSRVVETFGKVDLRRANEHAPRLRGCRLLAPLSGLRHGWEKNSGCHYFSPARRPNQDLVPALHQTQVRSAARNFALRDRGLRSTSSSSAVTG